MYAALRGLARLMHDPRIAERDSNKIENFSCLAPERREERKTYFGHALAVQKGAFDPVGSNGEMPRKFSERHQRDMFRRPSSTLDSSWAAGVKVSLDQDG